MTLSNIYRSESCVLNFDGCNYNIDTSGFADLKFIYSLQGEDHWHAKFTTSSDAEPCKVELPSTPDNSRKFFERSYPRLKNCNNCTADFVPVLCFYLVYPLVRYKDFQGKYAVVPVVSY
jgi:hypothetical protein